MYIDVKERKPRKGQLCLCECSNWCELGFQVAQWDGSKFDYPESPNDMFDKNVTGWIGLDSDGEPE